MANPKRRANVHARMAAAGNSRRSLASAYISLSQVEDVNDRTFFEAIARNAARNAINENRAMDIPVTIMENGWVVRKTASGIVEKIAEVAVINNPERKKTLTKGTVLHVKKPQCK